MSVHARSDTGTPVFVSHCSSHKASGESIDLSDMLHRKLSLYADSLHASSSDNDDDDEDEVADYVRHDAEEESGVAQPMTPIRGIAYAAQIEESWDGDEDADNHEYHGSGYDTSDSQSQYSDEDEEDRHLDHDEADDDEFQPNTYRYSYQSEDGCPSMATSRSSRSLDDEIASCCSSVDRAREYTAQIMALSDLDEDDEADDTDNDNDDLGVFLAAAEATPAKESELESPHLADFEEPSIYDTHVQCILFTGFGDLTMSGTREDGSSDAKYQMNLEQVHALCTCHSLGEHIGQAATALYRLSNDMSLFDPERCDVVMAASIVVACRSYHAHVELEKIQNMCLVPRQLWPSIDTAARELENELKARGGLKNLLTWSAVKAAGTTASTEESSNSREAGVPVPLSSPILSPKSTEHDHQECNRRRSSVMIEMLRRRSLAPLSPTSLPSPSSTITPGTAKHWSFVPFPGSPTGLAQGDATIAPFAPFPTPTTTTSNSATTNLLSPPFSPTYQRRCSSRRKPSWQFRESRSRALNRLNWTQNAAMRNSVYMTDTVQQHRQSSLPKPPPATPEAPRHEEEPVVPYLHPLVTSDLPPATKLETIEQGDSGSSTAGRNRHWSQTSTNGGVALPPSATTTTAPPVPAIPATPAPATNQTPTTPSSRIESLREALRTGVPFAKRVTPTTGPSSLKPLGQHPHAHTHAYSYAYGQPSAGTGVALPPPSPSRSASVSAAAGMKVSFASSSAVRLIRPSLKNFGRPGSVEGAFNRRY